MLLALCGLLVTFFWLVLSVWYVEETIGFEGMLLLLPNEIGQFVIGVFAPIAFLWLILGFFHVAQRLRRLEDNLWHQPVNLRHEALPPRAAAGTSFRSALQTQEAPADPRAALQPAGPPDTAAPGSPLPGPAVSGQAADSSVLTLSDAVPPPAARPDPAPLPPRPAGFEPRRANPAPPPATAPRPAAVASSASPSAPPSGPPTARAALEPAPEPLPSAPTPEASAPRGLAARLRSRFRDLEADEQRSDPASRSLNPLSLLGASRRSEPAPAPTPPSPLGGPASGLEPAASEAASPPASAPEPIVQDRAYASARPADAPPLPQGLEPPARGASFDAGPGDSPERADGSAGKRPRSIFRPSASERPRAETRPRSAFAPAERPHGAEDGRPASSRRPREEAAARLASRSAAEGTSLGGDFEPAEPVARASQPPLEPPPTRSESPRRTGDRAAPGPAPRDSRGTDSRPIEPRPETPAPLARAPEPAVRISQLPAAEGGAAAPTAPVRPSEPPVAPPPVATATKQESAPSGPAPNPAPKVVTSVTPAPPASAQESGAKPSEPPAPAGEEPPPAAATPEAPAGSAPGSPDPASKETVAAAPRATEGRPIGFRHLVRITTLDLNTLAMDLSSKLCRPAEHAKALKSYDRGEKDVFFDQVRGQLSGGDAQDLLRRLAAGEDVQLLERYAQRFERLLEESRTIDVSGALAKSLEAMAIGRLYGAIQGLRGAGGAVAASGTG